jgi:hypothetical protein
VVAALHWWWLCNSGGCSGVVCSEPGADLQLTELVMCTFPLMGLLTTASHSWPIVSSSSKSELSMIRIEFSAGSSFGTTWFIMIFHVSTELLDEHVLASVSGGMIELL